MLLLALAPCATAAPSKAAHSPMVEPWGVSLGYIDPSIGPGADFFGHANNRWIKTAQIPPDRSAAGTFLDLIIRNDQRLTAIFADLHGRTNLTEEERKLRDLYEAFMDTTITEAALTAPPSRRYRMRMTTNLLQKGWYFTLLT
jgi:predicted metalloendopeptidase